ncbi:hypothetical protein DY000_02022260 [Brassica cretica]|uniref:Replication protein A 70 kDa DNA-binding subunit B/D first OB fold domain-containing protein n=1 Tax=Brassica cretica TaxID=69181 RepID=A0ABQ7EB31_BRACR|nr:hypothetical protein DY000_02022260 [Brassica cretica]
MKVLHSWTQHSNYYGEDTFKFILEDKMGSKIHCTCKRVFLARVKKLHVGQWMFLENFSFYPATGMYRPTSHKYKMSITWNSIVTNSIRTTCEVRLIDHNKESSSEDVSTSFSKHKEGDADLNDMNSTSKKLCAKNIKMGKTDED